MSGNPYTLMFGKEPLHIITRPSQTEEIYQAFASENPVSQIYMLTGVRGAGKTVLMTSLSKRFEKEPDWIVLELNPANDLLTALASKLYNQKGLRGIFKAAKINLSFFGISIGADIKSDGEILTDIEEALARMLEQIKKKKKKVLITIDEVVSNKEMRTFASAFQILIRKDLPLYLLMTGLYENVDALQNNEILTFLHRAPKVELKALNLHSIEENYMSVFSIGTSDAKAMAQLTGGYPYAFQVLGYYTYEYDGDYRRAAGSTRQYIEDYVYDKIWSELSHADKEVCHAIATAKSGKTQEIREITGMEKNKLSPYRERLIKRGLVDGSEWGRLKFSLPFFREYVLDHS